jgi:hypothetical protein
VGPGVSGCLSSKIGLELGIRSARPVQNPGLNGIWPGPGPALVSDSPLSCTSVKFAPRGERLALCDDVSPEEPPV